LLEYPNEPYCLPLTQAQLGNLFDEVFFENLAHSKLRNESNLSYLQKNEPDSLIDKTISSVPLKTTSPVLSSTFTQANIEDFYGNLPGTVFTVFTRNIWSMTNKVMLDKRHYCVLYCAGPTISFICPFPTFIRLMAGINDYECMVFSGVVESMDPHKNIAISFTNVNFL